jgi:hypothetical protein
MKFITICLKEKEIDYDFVHINIDHIVSISDHWEKISEDQWKDHAKILLYNGNIILCDENVDEIKKEYKKLFIQY